MGEAMNWLKIMGWVKLVVVLLFAIQIISTVVVRPGHSQTTEAGYTAHILYCDTREDSIKLIEHLMVGENQLAREMLVLKGSSCHDTQIEQRPPMYAKVGEVLYTRFALGHTFTVENAVTPSGRIIYVMGATPGE